MTFRCDVSREPDGGWTVHHEGRDVGSVSVRGGTREEALEKMRRELAYRLELCPCTGEALRDVEIELVEE